MICADELGPVIPPQLPARTGLVTRWASHQGAVEYSRGTDKTWVYGALRIADGHQVTMTAPSRNSAGYQRLLAAVETANPAGTIMWSAPRPLSPGVGKPAVLTQPLHLRRIADQGNGQGCHGRDASARKIIVGQCHL